MVIHSWVGVQLNTGVFICLSILFCLLSGCRASGSQLKSARSLSICVGVSNCFTGWGVMCVFRLGGIVTGFVVNFLVCLLKISLFMGVAIMGAAMLPENVRYGVSFGAGNGWPKTGGS